MKNRSIEEVCENCFLLKNRRNLLDSSIEQFNQCRRVRSIQPDQTLMSQGSVPVYLTCLSHGSVLTQHTNNRGEPHLLFPLKKQRLFPISALFEYPRPLDYDVIAKTRSRVCLFPVKTVLELITKDLALTLGLLEASSADFVEFEERMFALLGKSAAHQVAQAIYLFRNEDNLCSLKRKEIAQWTNLATETVIRTIGQLEKNGLLEKTNEGLVIKDLREFEDYLGR